MRDERGAIRRRRASAHRDVDAIILGIEQGADDIFPDPASREMAALWARDPQALERAFAT
jgi:hypothetical protein